MNEATRRRLFGFDDAFDQPATAILLGVIGVILALAPAGILLARALGRFDGEQHKLFWRRYTGWLVIVPLLAGPILAGAFWIILVVALLSVLCYNEYARATGLFREKLISTLVVITVLAVHFTVLDNWYLLFVALFPLSVGAIASFALVQDRPKGYIQRVALGAFAFALFGSCLGHLGFLANDRNYRPLLIFFLATVQINGLAAVVTGWLLGRRLLCPNTSPNKTVAGALGAVAGTTVFVVMAGPLVFVDTPLDDWGRLLVLGVGLGIVGRFGDLMLSSIKRDLGLLDMDVLIPGHGGLLDRFDSLILVAPVMFHYVNYFVGVGADQQVCIFTGAR